MSQIARLRDAEIANGNIINADDLNAEFDQLVSESNSQDTRLTTIESNDLTITGVKTFNSTPKMNAISERSSDTGVTIDSVRLRDGAVKTTGIQATIASIDTATNIITTATHGLTTADPIEFLNTGGGLPGGLSAATVYYARAVSGTTLSVHTSAADANSNSNLVDITSAGTGVNEILGNLAAPENGELWYNVASGLLKARINGSTSTIATVGGAATMPQGYHGTAPPVYATAATFTVASIFERDSTNATDIIKTSSTTVNIANTGLNGLLGGGEASSTWYYLYAITDGITPGLALSVKNVAGGDSLINLPTGYTQYSQIPFALRNDGSSNFLPWQIANGWPRRPLILYNTNFGLTTQDTQVLNGGTQSSFTAVSCASFIPPISRMGDFYLHSSATSDTIAIRGKNSTTEVLTQINQNKPEVFCSVDSSQSIDYKAITPSTVYIAVHGYIVTEVN